MKHLGTILLLLISICVHAQDDQEETNRLFREDWEIGQSKFMFDTEIFRIAGKSSRIWPGITNIGYKTVEYEKASLSKQAGKEMWSEEKLETQLAVVNKARPGGTIYLYVVRTGQENANLNRFSIVVKTEDEKEVYRQDLEDKIPRETPDKTYYLNVAITNIPINIEGSFFIDIVEERYDIINKLDNTTYSFEVMKYDAVDPIKEFARLENQTWDAGTWNTFFNTRVVRSGARNTKETPGAGQTNIGFESIGHVKAHLSKTAEKEKWSKEKLDEEMAFVDKTCPGGRIYFYVDRSTQDKANLKNFAIEVQNYYGSKQYRKDFEDEVPEKGEGNAYWHSMAVVFIPVQILGPIRVMIDHNEKYNISRNGPRYWFEVKKKSQEE